VFYLLVLALDFVIPPDAGGTPITPPVDQPSLAAYRVENPVYGGPPASLALPFRIGPSGRPVTVEQGSGEWLEQQIAMAILTRPGERPLDASYGLPDPAEWRLSTPDILAVTGRYGPTIASAEVNVTPKGDTAQTIEVTVR